MFALRSIAAATRNMGAGGNAPASDTWWKNVVLLVNGDSVLSGASNTLFHEASSQAAILTANGAVTQGTFTPNASNWSVKLDGSSSVTIGTAPTVGTTYTFETWFYLATAISSATAIIGGPNVTNTWNVRFNSSTAIQVDSMNVSGQAFTVPTITAGVWHHLAVVRDASNNCTVFLDGVRSSTGAVSVSTSYSGPTTIGSSNALTSFNGYLSNLRMLNGTALYDPTQSTLTVPASTLSAIANTTLLVFNDGTLRDGSSSARTLTVSGTPRVSAFGPFGSTAFVPPAQGGAVFFDGTASYWQAPASAALAFGTGDFTVEAWIYPTANTAAPIIATANTSSDMNYYSMMLISGKLQMEMRTVAGDDVAITGATTVTTNTWHHVAVTRQSGTVKLWLDGVLDASGSNTYNFAAQLPTKIGGYPITGFTKYFAGYISNARVINGSARYTGTFIPSQTDLTAVTNTVLLTCQGSTVSDASASAFTMSSVGTAPVVRNISPFAEAGPAGFGGSVYSAIGGATATYLSTPSTSAVAFGTGDFTVDGWFYRTASGVSTQIISTTTANSSDFVYFNVNVNASNVIVANIRDGASSISTITGATTVTSNAWHHFALTRTGTTLRLFLDGTSQGTPVATATQNLSSSKPIQIGAFLIPTFEGYFQGYLSNLRIVNGTSLYSAAFTPPVSKNTAITNTTFLLDVSNGTATDISSSALSISVTSGTVSFVDQNPIQSGVTSKFGSAYFTGTSLGSYLSLPTSTAYGLGTGNFTIEAWIYPMLAQPGMIFDFRTTNGSTPHYFQMNANRTLTWGDGTLTFTPSGTFAMNSWSHVAVVRTGTTVTMYINGVSIGTNTSSVNLGSTNPVRIGANSSLGGADFGGYIAQPRITKAAVYTGAFTPSLALQPLTSTTLFAALANAGIYDVVGQGEFMQVGTPTISTSISKFGTGSISIPGAGSYIYTPIVESYGFGTGDFTIEGWLRCTASGLQPVFDLRDKGGAASQVKPFLYFNGTTLTYTVSNAAVITAASAIVANTWAHIAISRVSGSTKIFVNGTQVGSTYTDTNNYGATANVIIGTIADAVGSGSWPLNGTVDDVRITKGVGRYTANFTAPTGQFPTHA